MQTTPAPPAEQVLNGLWSIPVPIPGSPLPHVLAYAFAVPDGVVLVATRLRWSRPWAEITGIMRRAALGETAAHLTHLELRGRLERSGVSPLRWVVRDSRSPS